LSQIPSSDWCPEPCNIDVNGLKPTPLMTSPPKKNEIQNFTIFSNAN